MNNLIAKTAVFLTAIFVLLSGLSLCYAESKLESVLAQQNSEMGLKGVLDQAGSLIAWEVGMTAVPMLNFALRPYYDRFKIHPNAEDISLQHDYYCKVELYLYQVQPEEAGSRPVYYVVWELEEYRPLDWVEIFRPAGVSESKIESIKEGRDIEYEDMEVPATLGWGGLRILDKEKLRKYNYKEKKEESGLVTVATFYGYGIISDNELIKMAEEKADVNAGEEISDYWLKEFALQVPPDMPTSSDIAWLNGRRVRYYYDKLSKRAGKSGDKYVSRYYLALGDENDADFEFYYATKYTDFPYDPYDKKNDEETNEKYRKILNLSPTPRKSEWKPFLFQPSPAIDYICPYKEVFKEWGSRGIIKIKKPVAEFPATKP